MCGPGYHHARTLQKNRFALDVHGCERDPQISGMGQPSRAPSSDHTSGDLRAGWRDGLSINDNRLIKNRLKLISGARGRARNRVLQAHGDRCSRRDHYFLRNERFACRLAGVSRIILTGKGSGLRGLCLRRRLIVGTTRYRRAHLLAASSHRSQQCHQNHRSGELH